MVVLAAAIHHQRHHIGAGLAVALIIIGVGYYAWRRYRTNQYIERRGSGRR
jgi:hypothetical protein